MRTECYDWLMSDTSRFYPRIFALVVAAALGVAVWRILQPFLGPMTWAAFLAFMLYPLNLRLRRRFRGNRTAAAGVLAVCAPIVVFLPLSALSIEFVAQISSLLRRFQATAPNSNIQSIEDLRAYPSIARFYDWVAAHASFSPEQIQTWFVSGTRELLQRAASLGESFFLGALSSAVGVLLMLVLLFFFLRGGDEMIARARALIPLDEVRKEHLFNLVSGITRAIVLGTTLTALLQGFVLGVGFAIAGLASPVVFGVAATLLAMLPIGGSVLVWVPATLWLFFDGHWGYGIFMAIWGLMISSVDNILKPMLISGRAPISTLVVFVGVIGGIAAFGAIGLIAGPVILSLVVALLVFAEETRAGGGSSL